MYVDAWTIAAWVIVAASLAVGVVLAYGGLWFGARQVAASEPVALVDEKRVVAQEPDAANDPTRYTDAA